MMSAGGMMRARQHAVRDAAGLVRRRQALEAEAQAHHQAHEQHGDRVREARPPRQQAQRRPDRQGQRGDQDYRELRPVMHLSLP